MLDYFQSGLGGGIKPMLSLTQFFSGRSGLCPTTGSPGRDDSRKLPRLHTFSESSVGSPVEHFEFDGRKFSRSSLNYLLGLALLKKHLDGDVPRTVLEIGGGLAPWARCVRCRYRRTQVHRHRHSPHQFVAQHYLGEVLGKGNVATYAQTASMATIDIDALPQAAVLCSWQIEKLQGKVDLFVNFISFQEMEPHIVRNYLDHVPPPGRAMDFAEEHAGRQATTERQFRCVETPLLGDDYLAMLDGYELVERNVHPFGYQTVDGFNSELLLLRRKS